MKGNSTCRQCGNNFVVNKNADGIFCGQKCYREHHAAKLEKIKCFTCGKEFVLAVSEIKKRRENNKGKNIFCTHSCSAIFNNKPRRKTGSISSARCKCGKRKTYQAVQCQYCRNDEDFYAFHNKTLAEVKTKYFGSLKWKTVRVWARKAMIRYGIEKKCFYCSWKIHVETSHKKSIGSFPLTTKVIIVNSKENLIYLCPNCHWLFDHKPELLA